MLLGRPGNTLAIGWGNPSSTPADESWYTRLPAKIKRKKTVIQNNGIHIDIYKNKLEA